MQTLAAVLNPLLLFRALRVSVSGLIHMLKSERAFQQEVILLIAGSVGAFLLVEARLERTMLIGVLVLLLVVETINSAIEATIDRVGPEQHPLSKRAKDLGSTAVFLTLVLGAIVWGIVLL